MLTEERISWRDHQETHYDLKSSLIVKESLWPEKTSLPLCNYSRKTRICDLSLCAGKKSNFIFVVNGKKEQSKNKQSKNLKLLSCRTKAGPPHISVHIHLYPLCRRTPAWNSGVFGSHSDRVAAKLRLETLWALSPPEVARLWQSPLRLSKGWCKASPGLWLNLNMVLLFSLHRRSGCTLQPGTRYIIKGAW